MSSDDQFATTGLKSNSSGSYASTNSSLLASHYPKWYFIPKSPTQYDLNLSVEKGVWTTQKHNEGILDQAYHTSKDVHLIFGVNKSGEFYGYARMAGPVKGERKVSWASRAGDFSLSVSPTTGRHNYETCLPGSFYSNGSSARSDVQAVDQNLSPDVESPSLSVAVKNWTTPLHAD
ncbi:YT521-B-like domain-containing protein [Schizophyllum commune]